MLTNPLNDRVQPTQTIGALNRLTVVLGHGYHLRLPQFIIALPQDTTDLHGQIAPEDVRGGHYHSLRGVKETRASSTCENSLAGPSKQWPAMSPRQVLPPVCILCTMHFFALCLCTVSTVPVHCKHRSCTLHRGIKPKTFQLGPFFYPSTSNPQCFFNRPGVAGAVLHTASSLIN